MSTPCRVWSRFSVKKDTGTLKFKLVEPPPERFDDVMNLIMNHFIKEEAMHKASDICKSKEAIDDYEVISTVALKSESYHVVVCCLDNDNDEIGEIVGSSVTSLIKRDETSDLDKLEPRSKEVLKLLEMAFDLKLKFDLLEKLKVDQYYDGRGVLVLPKYRGHGIAQEMFKMRRQLCKERGVPVTIAFMTAYGTQKAAERDGWETVWELNMADFGQEHGVSFNDCPPIGKMMVGKAASTN